MMDLRRTNKAVYANPAECDKFILQKIKQEKFVIRQK